MKIVTGYRGENHISSNDMQSFNQCVFGDENYVFKTGSQFAAELSDNQTLVISDGDGIMQGVHFRIERGNEETIMLDEGSATTRRIDLVCARYEKDATTGVESVSLVVVKGEEVDIPASAPTPTTETGDIVGGDSPVDFPLYRVYFNGVTPTLTTRFNVYPNTYNKSMGLYDLLNSENQQVESSSINLISGTSPNNLGAYLVTLNGRVEVESVGNMDSNTPIRLSVVGISSMQSILEVTLLGTANQKSRYISGAKILNIEDFAQAFYFRTLRINAEIRTADLVLNGAEVRIDLSADVVKIA